MNFVTETLAARHIDRIVDLRRRLSTETDPSLRERLEAEIAQERHKLAFLLACDGKSGAWFHVRRDARGTPSLHLRHACLPVNAPYLEHLLAERGIEIPPEGGAPVGPDFAIDAIEEALAQVNHTLAVTGDLRRRLAYFHRIAETLASETGEGKACA